MLGCLAAASFLSTCWVAEVPTPLLPSLYRLQCLATLVYNLTHHFSWKQSRAFKYVIARGLQSPASSQEQKPGLQVEVSLMPRPPNLRRLGLPSGFILLQKHHWMAKWGGEGRVPSNGGE